MSQTKKSQTSFFKKTTDRFGHLDQRHRQRTTLQSRGARPISTKTSMHLILKSRNAVGDWSFLKNNRRKLIKSLVIQVAQQFGVKLLSGANVGNHIHLHLRFYQHHQYKAFVRVLTARISFLVTKANKFNPIRDDLGNKMNFWSQRPITRFVHGLRDHLNLEDYIFINRLEGHGLSRTQAEFFVKNEFSTS